jgi:hypothetical protein
MAKAGLPPCPGGRGSGVALAADPHAHRPAPLVGGVPAIGIDPPGPPRAHGPSRSGKPCPRRSGTDIPAGVAAPGPAARGCPSPLGNLTVRLTERVDSGMDSGITAEMSSKGLARSGKWGV